MEELNQMLQALQRQAIELCRQGGYNTCTVDINIWADEIFYICQATKPGGSPESLVAWSDYIHTPAELESKLRSVLKLHPATAPAHA